MEIRETEREAETSETGGARRSASRRLARGRGASKFAIPESPG
jgi:hypothetical protein